MSGKNNICQGVWKFGIIGKGRICCVWDNGQDFGNFEESVCQGMIFDTKLEPVVGRVYLPQWLA